ncbi:MAG: glutamate--tRNA ligase [Bacteroidetes bacterium]|nr:glutamate--tRNA ligase [Bacteroidota bacterium]
MSDRRIRVRFAPSPTGPLHLGGVRTALYNYLFAKKMGGDFILRIEDTDQNRFVPGAEGYIIESLKWAGLNFSEGPGVGGKYGPYRQSERKEMYRQYADQLVENGNAYYAFDTNEELEEMRERMTKAGMSSPKYDHITREYMKNSLSLPKDEVEQRLKNGEHYVIRIKIPRNEEIKLHDVIRGWVTVKSAELDDKVLFKSDGMPTYHLANVVDDYLMQISHVIRGEEWLPSAPTHVLLYRYLGWEEVMPKFAHLPLILKPDGNGKLSKRDGDRLGFPVFTLNWNDPVSGELSSGYREAGYLPEAYINILAMLGWHPSDNKELFSMDELVESFTLERVSKSGAKFDFEKAKWYNHQYLKTKDNAYLANEFKPTLANYDVEVSDEYLQKVCGLIKEKATFLKDFWSLGSYFFLRPMHYDESVIAKKWDANCPAFFTAVNEKFKTTANFTAAELQVIYEQTATEMNLKPGNYMQLFRVLISGQAAGPAVWEMVEVIGKTETNIRIETAIEKFGVIGISVS